MNNSLESDGLRAGTGTASTRTDDADGARCRIQSKASGPEKTGHHARGGQAPMPMRAHRVCNASGCGELIRGRTRYCEAHAHLAHPPTPRRPRLSPSKRGYGAAWRRLRKRILARDPVCRGCFVAGSTDVDHVVPRSQGGSDHPSNLQGLCRSCHSSKTAREDGGFGNPTRDSLD